MATRGGDEEALLDDLPMDIHRDIKRHLCIDLMLEAMCERLRPALRTRGTGHGAGVCGSWTPWTPCSSLSVATSSPRVQNHPGRDVQVI